MTGNGRTGAAGLPGPGPLSEDGAPRSEADYDITELIGGAKEWASVIYAPGGNINNGSVYGGQGVRNDSGPEGRLRESRVREGPIPDVEREAAAHGFARPDWFEAALAKLKQGPLFLAGRPGTGRRTAALNLLRESCGADAPLRALDGVTELDRWKPTDASARGYLIDGLFPSRPLSPVMLRNVRELLKKAHACMVIVLPDDTALLHRLERDLHISATVCSPPSPSLVFGSRFEAVVPDQWERDRLLSALADRHDLGELLVPELVPAEVVELVTALVEADGDPEALGDLGLRLSYRAEREVPELIKSLCDQPESLAFLLATSVYEGLDQQIVRNEADRLTKLAGDRLTAVLPGTDADGAAKPDRPNPKFVFRHSLTELLHAVRAVRQDREIRAEGAYSHSVEAVAFIRHRQAEAVLRHVWREYGQLSELLVEWLRDVPRSSGLAGPAGRAMGRVASWGGGHNALVHLRELARSDRATSRLVVANALGVAAEDPVLVAEIRYRLHRWSTATDFRLRTTVAHACGEEFGLARPDLALRLLQNLFRAAQVPKEEEYQVKVAVEAAVLRLFQAGNETKVFDLLRKWLDNGGYDQEQVLSLFSRMLWSPQWFMRNLALWTPEAQVLADLTGRALNTESSFETTCGTLLRWAESGQWNDEQFRAVENLFAAMAQSMHSGEFRLFVEMDQAGANGWPGLATARDALHRWRTGAHREAA
ncbi:hypothetical protein ACFCV8_11130 [Streptomyces sp. NPDC056347]|uniref:hypothetical protein n=1 Tax=Streptomyces sp. NPDC056347 TaxID=3345790 RepID=UPI0035DF2518